MRCIIVRTEEEAREKLVGFKNSNQREDVGFCPLIQKDCNTKCVCFVKPRVVKRQEEFHVYSARCDNIMFFGEFNV